MRKQLFFGAMLSVAAIFSACDNSGHALILPGKVGPIGEVVVVLPEKHWKSEIVDALREFSDRPYAVLPQFEYSFDLALLDPADFDRFWKPHRNIVFIDIADRIDTQTPSMSLFKNRYANDQVYAEVKGRTAADIATAIRSRGEELANVIHRAEVRRAGALAASFANEVLTAELKTALNVEVNFPKDAFAVKKNADFWWIQREMTRMKGGNNHDVKQGFFVYTYPYTSDSVFSYEFLVRKRNEVLRAYVHGQPEGSYMTTEMIVPPMYEEVAFDNRFTAELRGLWRMEGDFMGGPFYSMTFYDEANQRIVTAEGYAYAPYFNKREYIREVEGIIKTLKTGS